MGRIFSTLLAITVVASTVLARPAATPQVVFVNLGKLNPTLDVSIYPDLQFVALPGISSQSDMNSTGKAMLSMSGAAAVPVQGEPKMAVDYWNDKDAVTFGDNTQSPFKAIMVDKNLVGIWQGCIKPDDPLESEGEGEEETLEDAFKYYIEKGKPVKEESGKQLDATDNKGFLGVKIPDLTFTGTDGAEKTLSSIAAAGKPVLLVFIQVPDDLDLKNPQEAQKKAKESKEYWKATAIAIYKDVTSTFFRTIEKEFFDKKIKG